MAKKIMAFLILWAAFSAPVLAGDMAEVKNVRQREMQTKREIEAYSALIEVYESRTEPPTIP